KTAVAPGVPAAHSRGVAHGGIEAGGGALSRTRPRARRTVEEGTAAGAGNGRDEGDGQLIEGRPQSGLPSPCLSALSFSTSTDSFSTRSTRSTRRGARTISPTA